MEFVIGTKTDEALANHLLSSFRHINTNPGTLYIGYPVLPTEGSHHRLDAMFVSAQHGIVIFQMLSEGIANSTNLEDLKNGQNDIYAAMLSKLSRTPQLLERRVLCVPIHILSLVHDNDVEQSLKRLAGDDSEVIIVSPSSVIQGVSRLPGLANPAKLEVLNATIERILTIKPRKRRANVKQTTSRGAVLKEIEQQIANLDRDQKKGAIECPESPQRIRGLAGSGKTVVLALKAAYLHAEHPDWEIAISFFTRSLRQQFEDLIRRFYFDQTQDEPDWSKIQILPSWGSARSPGLYARIAMAYGISPMAFDEAKSRFGAGPEAFEGACDLLLAAAKEEKRPLFDAILIDEAQDLPKSFFRLAWLASKPPHRIVWAYDELQNLGNFSMPSPEELFGTNGVHPLVELRREADRPNPDVVLPKCYRNTPWTLTAAHALGLRAYGPKLAQWVEQRELWDAIGYEVRSGDFEPGSNIVLARRADSTPEFFERLIKPDDALKWHACASGQEQIKITAAAIAKNIRDDELDPDDILVVFTNPLTVRAQAPQLQTALYGHQIHAHVAGVTTSADDFSVENSVTISSILRAKGNEAPMVYVLDAQHCAQGQSKSDLARRRNVLFTALTRSRAWVRVLGYGEDMKIISGELEKIVDHNYTLNFNIPTEKELQALRLLGRDMSVQERKAIGSATHNLKQVADLLRQKKIKADDIPRKQRKALIQLLSAADDVDEDEGEEDEDMGEEDWEND